MLPIKSAFRLAGQGSSFKTAQSIVSKMAIDSSRYKRRPRKSGQDRQEQVDKLIKNYEYYKDRLLQVTQRNRSVMLKKIYARHNFDLTALDEFKPLISKKIVSKAVKNVSAIISGRKNGASQNILSDTVTDDDADSARGKLKTLNRNLRQIEEETGQQTGYLGFPFLQGHIDSDFYVRGPLALFPVSLIHIQQAKNSGWFINFEDKRPIINGALIAALRKRAGYNIPEDYAEQFDELIENTVSYAGGDMEERLFEEMSRWMGTLVRINKKRNEPLIQPIEPLGRDDIEKLETQPFHLVSHAVIGNFPQADNKIYDDYNGMIKDASSLDVGVIGKIIGVDDPDKKQQYLGRTEINVNRIPNAELNTILPSDSSQDKVILESKLADLSVVRGPPGTGKSQVIVNLISDALTNNKKILVVCQKRAALEVVKQRLDKADIGRYAVFLEKELDDRTRMYEQMYDLIEETPAHRLDAGTAVYRIAGRIDEHTEYLDDFGRALGRKHFGGISVHDLYSKADGRYRPVLDLKSIGFDIKWPNLEPFLQKINDVAPFFKKFESSSFPWSGRKSFERMGIMEKKKLDLLLQNLISLASGCTLAGSAEKQSELAAAFDEYAGNFASLKKQDQKLARGISEILKTETTFQFVSDNSDGIGKGAEFWEIFPILLGVFDDRAQQSLISMTRDVDSLALRLADMKKSLEEFDAAWSRKEDFAAFDRTRTQDAITKIDSLIGLLPDCLLTYSSAMQRELLEQFEAYSSDSGVFKRERKKAAKEIEKILGAKATDKFVSENEARVRNGVSFWKIFPDVLDSLGHREQKKLASMIYSTEELKSRLSGIRDSLKGIGTAWFGRAHISNSSAASRNAAKQKLQRMIELAPRCKLAGSAKEQARLRYLFDAYRNDSGFLKRERKKAAKEIEEILHEKVTDQFVYDNFEDVKNGVEFWRMLSDKFDIMDNQTHEKILSMIHDSKLLVRRLSAMLRSLEVFDAAWQGLRNAAEIDAASKSDLERVLGELAQTAPKCMLAGSAKEQLDLQSLCKKYLSNFKSLDEADRRLSRTIYGILGAKATDELVSDNMAGVKKGAKFWESFPELLEFFEDEKQKELAAMASDPESLQSYLSQMYESLAEFDAMQELDKKKGGYDDTVFQMLNHAMSRFGIGDDWHERIKQEIYTHWLSEIEQSSPILKGDPISNYQNHKRDLAKLLVKKRDAVKAKIQHDIESAVDLQQIYRPRTYEGKAWKELSRELKRKRKVKPVRALFQNYPSLMFKIAPCWLASPESVSKVFPLERRLFDLVVVDEASQLAVERAIPFLYRADRVVIAGDEKQLPPFDLFQIREDEADEEDEQIAEEKSLLELARVNYTTSNLSWHYRSLYQELISFSNHAFYEGLLNVAPNTISFPASPPIRWIRCNGVWSKNQNHVEAVRVVDEIKCVWDAGFSKAQKYPSIGVITFNEKQQELIKDIIDKRIDSDPEFSRMHDGAHADGQKNNSLFVKNIENVQGDERDVIIFSIGYAKDPEGNFANRYGTINKKGGENRLNVAITRAKREMAVVSSIDPLDIKAAFTNIGPLRFRQFLEYAKMTDARNKEGQKQVLHKVNPDMRRVSKSKNMMFDSDFEQQVHEKLTQYGHKVMTQIGESGYRIDLAVVHPHDETRYILGIECDGATFHSAKSVKERDVMRQMFLEGKGWKIERIWSRNWWRNPGREIERINDRIRELAA